MSGWDDLDQALSESGGSGGDFINLQDGESVTGVICGHPHREPIFWTGSTYIPWVDSERSEDDRKTFQVSVNFYDVHAKKMRVLQGKVALGIALSATVKKYGKETGRLINDKPEKLLQHRVFEVKRIGEKRSTSFQIFLEPDIRLPEDMGQMHDLAALAKRGNAAARGEEDEAEVLEKNPQAKSDLPF